ncbi:hypothetical protein GA0115240_135237 [Streptomyces sp. DvalAA-14]|uniref:hypothetical protein n=1 Tax=unclassified Streptomyces TaxID=2593676 RepID=UPI00081B085E|nr:MULTISPECIES: hypothetical protein [unclassified Streptomyces]MYS21778.1 hypothetical protein [Streptomyces sp. SID4948]SCE01094.1 hypothetical protein GA0115240_135237 [Streptomyces sp. DvalAA-14]
MDIVPDYVFILPVVIIAAWILSWWGTQRVRWILLSAAAVVSVLCVVFGWHVRGPSVDPRTVGCSPAVECMDARPLYLLAAGLLGIGCCLVLLILTLMGEAIRIWRADRDAPAGE